MNHYGGLTLPVPSPFVSVALLRLRRAVTTCCWTAGAALTIQVLVWCVASFTESRVERIGGKDEASVVITPSESTPEAAASAPAVTLKRSGAASTSRLSKPVDPNVGVSRLDPILATLSSLALAAGTLAVMILMLVLTLGVLVGASSSIAGVDDTVAAFLWATLVVVLALPWGNAFGLPWREGGFVSYALMTQHVETELAGGSWGGIAFYARFAMLPLACVASLVVVGIRFTNGVSAGILAKDRVRLDPALEKETAGIRPTSLHGGRAGNAILAAIRSAPAHEGPVTQLSAGAAPRRLI